VSRADLDRQFVLVDLAADLGPLLLALLALRDITIGRSVGRRRKLVGIVVIDPGRYPLLLGPAGPCTA
jgi:hypothetical protein